jgi:hypothetical protein
MMGYGGQLSETKGRKGVFCIVIRVKLGMNANGIMQYVCNLMPVGLAVGLAVALSEEVGS